MFFLRDRATVCLEVIDSPSKTHTHTPNALDGKKADYAYLLPSISILYFRLLVPRGSN